MSGPGLAGYRHYDDVIVCVHMILDPGEKGPCGQRRLDEKAALEGLGPALMRLQVIDEIRVVLACLVEVVVDPVNCQDALLWS